jgi:hypothetical protein
MLTFPVLDGEVDLGIEGVYWQFSAPRSTPRRITSEEIKRVLPFGNQIKQSVAKIDDVCLIAIFHARRACTIESYSGRTVAEARTPEVH